jgi:hypothetical protein
MRVARSSDLRNEILHVVSKFSRRRTRPLIKSESATQALTNDRARRPQDAGRCHDCGNRQSPATHEQSRSQQSAPEPHIALRAQLLLAWKSKQTLALDQVVAALSARS